MILFWADSGPFLKYANGVLHIEDLNPVAKLRWRMSRLEMFRLGWCCITASLGRA